jgi:hypothetical protein
MNDIQEAKQRMYRAVSETCHNNEIRILCALQKRTNIINTGDKVREE